MKESSDYGGSKVVLAYSGGLDTSVMVKWLKQNHNCEVVTFTGDLGQQIDLKEVAEKAKTLGVKNTYCSDLKEEFIQKCAFQALKANALYDGKYPISTAIGRHLLVEKLVQIAEQEGAVAIAHGCTGKGNDQVRFEIGITALAPHLGISAPVREWGLTRPEEIAYAEKQGIPIPEKIGKYSIDENLWGRSIECGPLEDPSYEADDDVFEWTVASENAPDKAEYVTIGFEGGIPVSLNGKELQGAQLVQKLNEIGGAHGVGRIDHMENRLIGLKSREIYECPAAMILIESHKDLEKLVLTKHVLHFKELVDKEWAKLVYNGLWADPLKDALDSFVDHTQQYVNGEVKVKLYKGHCSVVSRKSDNSIYDKDLASYSEESSFDQNAAKHFIKLWGLQSVLFNLKNNGKANMEN